MIKNIWVLLIYRIVFSFCNLIIMVLSSSKFVFLSSWSRVFSNKFMSALFDKTLINNNGNLVDECKNEKYNLIYIPTAKFAYDPKGQKSKGEQRRFGYSTTILIIIMLFYYNYFIM